MSDERSTKKTQQKKNNFVSKFRSKFVISGTSSNSDELAGRVMSLVRLPPKCNEDPKKILSLRRLLQKGAPPNYRHFVDKVAALHAACLTGDYLAAKELIQFGADVNIKDWMESSPLHLAARHDRDEIIRLLVNNGAHINCQDLTGLTPLHEAASQQCADTLRTLLDRNADTASVANHSSYFGHATPFSYAVRAGELECILVFLQKGESLESFEILSFLQFAHDKGMNLKILNMLIEASLQIQSCRQEIETEKFRLWPKDFWLTWLDSPVRLDVQCRRRIRSLLGLRNLRRAEELPLPQSVINRLMYCWPDYKSCTNFCSKLREQNTFNIYSHKIFCECI